MAATDDVPIDEVIAHALAAAEEFARWARKQIDEPSAETCTMMRARAMGAFVALMALDHALPDELD